MKTMITPFNVRLLQLSDASVRNLRPIRSGDPFDGATKNFHTDGLFSNEIFGQVGSKERMTRFAYIDVKVPIMHPLAYKMLGKLKRIYPEIMIGKQYARFDESIGDFVKSDPVDGRTGYTFFMEYFPKLVFPQRLSDQRSLTIKFIERVRSTMFNTKIVVIPAGYRDYVILGEREEEDEVNALFRKLLGNSNNITPEMFRMSPEMYDRTRASMQHAWNAIYEYYESIIYGKNKHIQGGVMTTSIRDGSRSVFTAQNLEVKELFGEGTPDTNTTGIGLFQFVKAARPKCIFAVQNGFLQNVFRSPGAPARLVNSKTLHAEEVQLPIHEYDLWMTKEGIEKLFNLFSEVDRRHDALWVMDYYLGLIYNDGKTFKLFSDIRELPENLDPKNVRPMTFAEFLYIHVYELEDKVALNVTRFPVTGFGSIYPSIPFLKPTAETVSLVPLDDNWLPDTTRKPAREFPIVGQAFFDTLMPSPDKLKGMTADFDGDKGTGNILMTDDAVAEAKSIITSRSFHVRPNGSLAHSLTTDTVIYLLGNLTTEPQVTPEVMAKFAAMYPDHLKAPASEDIREDLTGVVRKFKKKDKDDKEPAKEGDTTDALDAATPTAIIDMEAGAYVNGVRISRDYIQSVAKAKGVLTTLETKKLGYARTNAKDDRDGAAVVVFEGREIIDGFKAFRAASETVEALVIKRSDIVVSARENIGVEPAQPKIKLIETSKLAWSVHGHNFDAHELEAAPTNKTVEVKALGNGVFQVLSGHLTVQACIAGNVSHVFANVHYDAVPKSDPVAV